jgi:hypothetical protein
MQSVVVGVSFARGTSFLAYACVVRFANGIAEVARTSKSVVIAGAGQLTEASGVVI